ncbi:MAG: restriction endonuclease subunit S [Crocosphaera sp.]|nr:restriction endonuclease subunit S [Crocosphaera sp.]
MNLETFFNHFELLADAPNGVQKLRELILQLAVMGKLVPQDKNDEPASVLLEKIKVEKAELVKEKKIKKYKPLPPITDDEIPYDLPIVWEWVRLGDIVNYNGVSKVSPQEIMEEAWVLGLEDIEKDTSKIIQRCTLKDRNSKSTKAQFKKGDVLYGKLRPYLNKVIIADMDGFCTTEIVPLPFYLKLCSKYLLYSLKRPDFLEYVNSKTYGVKMPRLGTDDGCNALFPLPPLNEQHRIVKKLDQLMNYCDELETQRTEQKRQLILLGETATNKLINTKEEDFKHNWQQIQENFELIYSTPENIKQLRQTILQLAVMGKLVPQDENDETAFVLLEKIKAEKAKLIKEKKIKKSKPLPPITDDEIPYDLPIGWEWMRFSELGELRRGKSKHRARNAPILYENGKYPMIQTADVARANGFITTYTTLYNDVGLAQSRLWKKGTLCITIAANIADSGILNFDACFPDSVVGFVPFQEIGNVKYFEYFMRTAKQHLQNSAPSTAQKNINVSILEQVLIPLPPLSELKRIVKKVDQLMKYCDDLEKQLTQGIEYKEKLIETAIYQLLAA